MAVERLYQGIVVTQNPRKHRLGTENNFLVNYYYAGDSGRDTFEFLVDRGFIYIGSKGCMERKLDILASEWLDEPTEWKEIKGKGDKMKASLGR